MAYEQKHKYGYRDALQKGDSEKVIKGEYFDDEFEAIEEALNGLTGGDDSIDPIDPAFKDVVFQNRTEDQQVVSKFTFAVDGQEPLTVENTGIWAGVNYVKYVSADTTWKILPGLDVEGDLSVDGNIDATGNISLDGDLAIGGVIEGDLTINGSITIDGNVIDGDGNIPDQLPHGSVSGATLRWNDTDEKWEETAGVKIPYGADNGDLQVTLTTITPNGAIYNSRGDGSGLFLGISQVSPIKNRVPNDGEVDLGESSYRFKDGFFSGAVNAGSMNLRSARLYDTSANGVGILFSPGASGAGNILPTDADGQLADLGPSIGSDARRFNNGWFAGTVTAGAIVSLGNVIAYSSSDERLKENITPMPVGLIDDIKPVQWDWKEGGKSAGVVAQQLQAIGLDDFVREAPNGELGVDYNALVGVLLTEVIELKRQINER